MSSGQLDFDSLRQTLDKRLLGPLFLRISAKPPADLPPIVFENRRRRARQRLADALASRGSDKIPKETRTEIENLVRDWSERAFEDGFPQAEGLEIRLARERELVMAAESGDEEEYLRVAERDYRRRVLERFGKIELRGIQTSHRVLAELDKVYVPLRLKPARAGADSKEPLQFALEFGFGEPATEVVGNHAHVLVVGSPGSGKSTLVAFLAAGCASGRLSKDSGWENDPLPLVLVVREWDEAPRILADIAAQLDLDLRVIDAAIDRNRAVLIVDGLDETPAGRRAKWIKFLHEFVERNSGCRVVVTSRPAGPPGEIESRAPFLKPYELSDLTRADTDQFIDNWCLAAELSVRTDSAKATREAKAAADDLKSRIASSRAIQRLAVNPLLTANLCVVHRFLGRKIPEHRVTLYEKCTDALLYEWDQAKFSGESAVGKLDANQKRALLRGIARKLHEEHAAEIAESEVVEHFARTLPSLGRPASDAEKIVAEIRDRGGVLVERRRGVFGFSHFQFQEYLAALDFVQQRLWQELTQGYLDPWWQEVIVLGAGAPGADSGRIANNLLSKGKLEGVVVAALCLESAAEVPLVTRREVERRLRQYIPPQSLLVARLLQMIGITVAPLLVKSLTSTSIASEKAAILWTLWKIDYEPAIPIIARIALDSDDSGYYLVTRKPMVKYHLSLGEFAVLILAYKAYISDGAMRALRSTLSGKWDPNLLMLSSKELSDNFRAENLDEDSRRRGDEVLRLLQEAQEAFRVSTPGKRNSTRARSTV